MTKEEKINTLKAIIQECEEYQWQRKETLFEIIKDLEQEPIFDKIRAEIKQAIRKETVVDCSGGEYERTVSTIDLDDVLEIIDKHKAESEVEE